MHYLTAMTESKSVKNVGVITSHPFFIGIFLRKLMDFLRIAHVSWTIGSWCFIGSFYTFAFDKRPYCTTWLWYQNENLFKIIGIINDWPFLYPYFCMKFDRIFTNCSCFIDFRLLMLYQIRRSFDFDKRPYCTTWVRCQSQNLFKNVGIINDWHFLYWHFCIKIDRVLRIAHVSWTIGYWCFIGSF